MTKTVHETVVVGLSARNKLSRLAGLILEEQGHTVKYLHIEVAPKVKSLFGWDVESAGIQAWAKDSGRELVVLDLTKESDAWVESEALRSIGQCWVADLRGLFDSDFLVPRLAAWARDHGANKLSTGHRCRISAESEKDFSLWRARDIENDQSAWIAQRGRKLFSMLNLPLGYLKVAEIEKLCVKHEISRGGEKLADETSRFADYARIPELIDTKSLSRVKQRGYVIDETQKVLGEHPGLLRFCVGTRVGLEGLTGVPPDYVMLGADIMKQWLIVGPASKFETSSACLTTRAEWCVAKPKLFGTAEVFDVQVGFKDPKQNKTRAKLLLDSMLRLEKVSETEKLPPVAGRRITLYRGALCLGSAQVIETYL